MAKVAAASQDSPRPTPSLALVQSGAIHKPPRILLYGIHGIGKTTFGAEAPSPIFIPTEEGASELEVAKFPVATSAEDVIAYLRVLYKEDHPYKTMVLDSADWLEDFIFGYLRQEFSDKELAYGKDSQKAEQQLGEILTAINYLRDKRNMTCIIIAHSEIKRFDSPMTEPYDRYQPKLQHRLSSLLQEWSDAVLFATYDVSVKKADVGFNKEARRGVSAGDRIIYTEERPAFYAKNRYKLPEEIPLKWERFAEKIPYFATQK
jgi:hypothetical protein